MLGGTGLPCHPAPVHWPLEQECRAGVKSTGSGRRAPSRTRRVTLGKSLPASSLIPARGCLVGVRVCEHALCTHTYMQTAHTFASHEMFISYMDVQTCMARKTPSLHVHTMGVPVGLRTWAPPKLGVTLSKLHPLPQFLLCAMRAWALPTSTICTSPTLLQGKFTATEQGRG